MHHSDVNPASRIGLKFTETHRTSSNREVMMDYAVSDYTSEVSATKRIAAFPSLLSSFGISSMRPSTPSQSKWLDVKIKFPDMSEVSHLKDDTNWPHAGFCRSQATTRARLRKQPRWSRTTTA